GSPPLRRARGRRARRGRSRRARGRARSSGRGRPTGPPSRGCRRDGRSRGAGEAAGARAGAGRSPPGWRAGRRRMPTGPGAGCGGGGTSELVIGEYGSLTGNDATFGQSTRNGVEIALEERVAQSQGKIGGLKLRVQVEDDQSRAEEAATVVQKLINQDRVIAV